MKALVKTVLEIASAFVLLVIIFSLLFVGLDWALDGLSSEPLLQFIEEMGKAWRGE